MQGGFHDFEIFKARVPALRICQNTGLPENVDLVPRNYFRQPEFPRFILGPPSLNPDATWRHELFLSAHPELPHQFLSLDNQELLQQTLIPIFLHRGISNRLSCIHLWRPSLPNNGHQLRKNLHGLTFPRIR
jgi:hypothetical protein